MPVEFQDLTEFSTLGTHAEAQGAPTAGINFELPSDHFGPMFALFGTAAYILGGPTPPPVVDDTAPVVTNYLPPGGTVIEATDPIQFDVTDDSGSFARILITVTQKGIQEVVHDGDIFKGLYAGLSERVIIAGGFRYTVARQGGWTDDPTFEPFAIDAAGNEAP